MCDSGLLSSFLFIYFIFILFLFYFFLFVCFFKVDGIHFTFNPSLKASCSGTILSTITAFCVVMENDPLL